MTDAATTTETEVQNLGPGRWLVDGQKVFTKPSATEAEAIATLYPPPPTAEERAEQAAAQAAAARARAIKAECRARILDLVNESAQANIAQAGVIYASMRTDGADASTARDAVGFAEGDLTTATKWKAWVGAMQTECRRAIADGEDPVWPDVPAGVSEMAARF